jgi:hypothetical protein
MDRELQSRLMYHRNERPIGVDRGSLVKELVRRFDRVKDDEIPPERMDLHYIAVLFSPSGINFVLAGSRYIEQIPEERQGFWTRWKGKAATRGFDPSVKILREPSYHRGKCQ